MKSTKITNTPIEIKNEDGGLEMLVQEYEVTREMYKGRCPVTSKYVTIFVPHSVGQNDSAMVTAAITDYRERGYSVNVMHSGSEPLKSCMYDLLHNNRNTEPSADDSTTVVIWAAGYRLGDQLLKRGKHPPKVTLHGIEKPQSLSCEETKEGQFVAMGHARGCRDDLLAALGVEPLDNEVHPEKEGANQ